MTADTRLRRVEAADLAAIVALNEAAVPNVNSISLDDFATFARDAAYFSVASVDGRVAAFLVGLTPDAVYQSPNFVWFRSRYERFVYIDRIVVDETLRGSGLGRLLYGDIESFAKSRGGLLTCEVNVRPRNEGSLAFHERMGFGAVGEQDTEGGAKRVRLMAKELG